MNSKTFKLHCYQSTSLIVLFCAFAMFGCDSKPKTQNVQVAPSVPTTPGGQTTAVPVPLSRVGKYINVNYPLYFIELKGDGTYVIQEGNKYLTGKYTIIKDKLTLAESTLTTKINDQGIRDGKGVLWTKQ